MEAKLRKQMNVRLPSDLIAELGQIAATRQCTKEELVRSLIEESLKKRQEAERQDTLFTLNGTLTRLEELVKALHSHVGPAKINLFE